MSGSASAQSGHAIVRVKFVDFWEGFDPERNYFTDLIGDAVAVEISDRPEVVFFSSFGREHEKFPDAMKVFYTGENVRPNRMECDYSIGFDHLGSLRHFRWPLYNLYPRREVDCGNRSGFCSIVVSNPNSFLRLRFAERLDRRRPVAYGGKVRNNVGGPIGSKLDFISRYRFNIAFENSSYPGYTTEKLFEAKLAGCIPIYWGDPRVSEDFDPDAFIDLSTFPSWDACIEHILEVDDDPSLSARYIGTPLVPGGEETLDSRADGLRAFLAGILRCGTRRPKIAGLARRTAVLNRMRTRKIDRAATSRWPEMAD